MMSPGGMLAEETVRVLVVLLVTSLLATLERRRPTDYGLGGVRAIRLCFTGGAWGFVTLSLLVGALKLTGSLTFSGPEMSSSAALGLGLRWLLAFFAVAFFEETALRGYLQYALARITGFWWAALIWSVVFLLMHGTNGGEGIVGLIQTGWIALFFCLSLWLTGSLWWAIGFHAAWDWSESYFYGTADSGVNVGGHLFSAVPHGNPLLSGGSTGPEGSLLALFVLAVPTIALWLTYRGTKELRWKAVR
ncbi:MAG TPA: CPBP family intramembrane glutamic endopeptidase [Granulicella sp.]